MAVAQDDLGPLLLVLIRTLMEAQYGPLGLHGKGAYWPVWALEFAKEQGWK